MKILLFISVVCVFACFKAKAQTIEWERVYNMSPYFSTFESLDKTEDSNIITVAGINNVNNPNHRVVYLKPNGDTIWVKNLSSSYYAGFYTPVKALNNGFLVTAYDNVGADTSNLHIIKLNIQGDIVWHNKYLAPRITAMYPRSIVEVSSNQYLIMSDAINYKLTTGQGGGSKYNVRSIDSLGNTLWQHTYDSLTTSIDEPVNMFALPSGKIIIHGKGDAAPPNVGPYFRKFNFKTGDSIYSKRVLLLGTGVIYYYTLYGDAGLSSDASIFLVGSKQFNINKSNTPEVPFIAKFDTLFNLKWVTTLNGLNSVGRKVAKVIPLGDNSCYVLTNKIRSDSLWMYKISGNGNVLDSTLLTSALGNFNYMEGIYFYEKDSSILYASSIIGSIESAYIAKIRFGKALPLALADNAVINHQVIKFYPVPIKESLTVESTGAGTLQLYDNTGKEVAKTLLNANDKQVVNFSGMVSGGYTYRFVTSQFVQTGKVVKE